MAKRKKQSKIDRVLVGIYKATVLMVLSIAEDPRDEADPDLHDVWTRHIERAEEARIPERRVKATLKRAVADAKDINDALDVLPKGSLVKLSNTGTWSIVGEGLA